MPEWLVIETDGKDIRADACNELIRRRRASSVKRSHGWERVCNKTEQYINERLKVTKFYPEKTSWMK